MTHTYYQHVLTTEGKTVEDDPCQLLVTRMDGDNLTMMPATQVSGSGIEDPIQDRSLLALEGVV